MIIKPKFRGFVCATAHPEGCAYLVKKQIQYVKTERQLEGPKRVLVIGASTGYGLASRIVAAFGCGASTIGVSLEKNALHNTTATAGWYNTVTFEKEAAAAGLYSRSINGDAFSNEIKEKTIELIKQDLKKIDLVVYSIAAPRRTDPATGEMSSSVIKPIGKPFTSKTINLNSHDLYDVTLEPASEEEIRQTVKVMGGEDWQLWLEALENAGVLAEGVKTVSYSYIGPELTYPIYTGGTIGKAKEHLVATAKLLNDQLESVEGQAFVSVNKALVTQASAAIPVVPLYLMLLTKVMESKNINEDCIEQIYRLFADRLYAAGGRFDETTVIRIDDRELREDVQAEVLQLWEQVCSGNQDVSGAVERFRREFLNLFGFEYENIDYEQESEAEQGHPHILTL